MHRLQLLLIVGMVLCATFWVREANAGGDRTAIVARVNGEVGPAMARYLERVVAEAERRDAELLLVVLDTPGGLDVSMRVIVQRLLGASVPVVVYVGPPGARAASAGTFITMAADIAAMAPGTTIGAAHPVMVAGGEIIAVDPVLLEKVTNDAVGYIRGLAGQRARNADWAERAVRESVVLGASDALRERVVDVVASSIDDLFAQIDGRRVAGPWGTRALHTHDIPISEMGPSLAESALGVVAQPTVAYLLCVVGLLLIGAELFTATGGALGTVGTICLVASLVGFDSLPIRWAGVTLLGLGISLVVAEVKAGGHGVLAVAGVIVAAIGTWWMFPEVGPTIAGVPARPSTAVVVGVVGLLGALTAVIVGSGVAMILRPARSNSHLIGETGEAATALDLGGLVRLRGELWSGRSVSSTMESGTRIRVCGRDGLTLLVERERDPEQL